MTAPMIAPIIIVCRKRYALLATIAVETFLRHHDVPLYIVADEIGEKKLAYINSKNLQIIRVEKYREIVADQIGVKDYHIFVYDRDGRSDRAYSSLKPLIMERVISEYAPESKYILSMDADTMYSGNIIDKVILELDRVNHEFDMYMVARNDRRMLRTRAGSPGSGFTLWKKESRFIKNFRERCSSRMGDRVGGGSQNLVNAVRTSMSSMLFTDPLLHMVSPDLQNPRITDQEISKMKPAYIHLHGRNSYTRLQRFKRVFEMGG